VGKRTHLRFLIKRGYGTLKRAPVTFPKAPPGCREVLGMLASCISAVLVRL
jgi:hypothetical protein